MFIIPHLFPSGVIHLLVVMVWPLITEGWPGLNINQLVCISAALPRTGLNWLKQFPNQFQGLFFSPPQSTSRLNTIVHVQWLTKEFYWQSVKWSARSKLNLVWHHFHEYIMTYPSLESWESVQIVMSSSVSVWTEDEFHLVEPTENCRDCGLDMIVLTTFLISEYFDAVILLQTINFFITMQIQILWKVKITMQLNMNVTKY